jgi:lambda repressor-like predicted transcriptional regulator
MSITSINIKVKQSVLLRLIKSGESLEDASSKAGLCIKLSKNYLNTPKNPFAIF